MALGLAFGVAWSPRAQDEGGARSSRGHHARGEAGGLPDSTEASRKLREDRAIRKRRKGPGVGELTREALIQSFSGLANEEANLMELARSCGMITTMGESEARDLLLALARPQEGDAEDADEMRGIISAIVFTRLCELNGPEAMGMVAAGELGEEFDDDFVALGMNSWMAADPEGAGAWFYEFVAEADELADGVRMGEEEIEEEMTLLENNEFLAAAMRGLAKHDASALSEYVEEIADVEFRELMEMKVFEAAVANETSAEGLLALLEQDLGEASHERREAVLKLSELDLAAAVQWVEKAPVGAERDSLVSLVASEMLEDDPASGAEWYMSQELVSEEIQSDRMEDIVSQWGYKNLEAADEWLSAQSNDEQRDPAEARLAQIASYKEDWRKAMNWIGEISDEEVRNAALREVFNRGYRRGGGAVNADLNQAAEEAGFGEAAEKYQN